MASLGIEWAVPGKELCKVVLSLSPELSMACSRQPWSEFRQESASADKKNITAKPQKQHSSSARRQLNGVGGEFQWLWMLYQVYVQGEFQQDRLFIGFTVTLPFDKRSHCMKRMSRATGYCVPSLGPALFWWALSTCSLLEQMLLAWLSYPPAWKVKSRESIFQNLRQHKENSHQSSILRPGDPGRPESWLLTLTQNHDLGQVPFSFRWFVFPSTVLWLPGCSLKAWITLLLAIPRRGVAWVWLAVIYLGDFQRHESGKNLETTDKMNCILRPLAGSIKLYSHSDWFVGQKKR